MEMNMQTIIGVYEVKTHFSNLLSKVSSGAEFTITRYGIPVAKLISVNWDKEKITKAIGALKKVRKGCHLNGLNVKDLVNEGRR